MDDRDLVTSTIDVFLVGREAIIIGKRHGLLTIMLGYLLLHLKGIVSFVK